MKSIRFELSESSSRVIRSSWQYARSVGGVLQVPTVTSFPTDPVACELVFNSLSGTVVVRNALNTAWLHPNGAPANGSFVLTSLTSSTPSGRLLAGSTSINVVDGGSIETVSINDTVVATVSGTLFTGPVSGTFSGSLQNIVTGLPWLIGSGTYVSVTTQSNGQLVVTNTFTTGTISNDSYASYLTLGPNVTLHANRVLTSSNRLSMSDNGSVLSVDLAATGTAGTYNLNGAEVNNKGQFTSGSTTYMGRHLLFVTGSSAEPFSNATTTYRAALQLTASNITAGIYRFGWSYVFYMPSTSVSFKTRVMLINSASHDQIEELSDIGANERIIRTGFAYVRVTGSSANFALEAANESGTGANMMYDRAIELWRVS